MLHASVPACFEIPVADIDRAQCFGEALLGISMKRQRYMGDTEQARFPSEGVHRARATPSVPRHVRDSEGNRVARASVEVA
jgi:hypothetical protein